MSDTICPHGRKAGAPCWGCHVAAKRPTPKTPIASAAQDLGEEAKPQTSHGWIERPDAYHGALVDEQITSLARRILLEHTSVRGWASETLIEYGYVDHDGDRCAKEFYPRGRKALILWLEEP